MRAVLHIMGGAFQDVWGDLWTMLVCNLLWILSNLSIVAGPPATLALFYYTNRLANGEVADLSDYWKAFRRYWATAWRWGAVNLAVIAFLLGDIFLTGQSEGSLRQPYIQGLYLALLAGWLAWQLFTLPFLFEQETMSVRQALRNGAALIGNNPGFAIALVGILLLVFAAGTALFMLSVAFGPVLAACAGNRAVLNRLEVIRQPGESA